MATVYGETPQDVVIDIVRSLGWLRQIRYPDRDSSFTKLFCEMGSGRRCVLWLLTYVIHVETPCSDLVADLQDGNRWNQIHGGSALLYEEYDHTMVFRTGISLAGGVTREHIRFELQSH